MSLRQNQKKVSMHMLCGVVVNFLSVCLNDKTLGS